MYSSGDMRTRLNAMGPKAEKERSGALAQTPEGYRSADATGRASRQVEIL